MSKEAASGPPSEYVKFISSSVATTGSPMSMCCRGVLRDHPLLGRLAALHLMSWSGNTGALLRVSTKTWLAASSEATSLTSAVLGIAVSVGRPRPQGNAYVTRHRYVDTWPTWRPQ